MKRSPARCTGAIALAIGIVLLAINPNPAAARESRPNFVVFMAEDLGPRIGAFGDPVARTPHIDALAERGVRYTRVFTTAGVCAPSRAAHITGMHQVALGAQHMRTSSFEGATYRAVPPPEAKAYPELLRRAGYYTLTTNKLDYQFSDVAPGSGPFTVWDAEGPEPDWSGRADGQPFYALFNLFETHESQLFDARVAQLRASGRARVTDPASVAVPPYYPDTPTVREAIARQYDNVHAMDRRVGEMLADLRARGLLDNTVVVWTTDHGDGLPRAKRDLYDSGIHVPMVIAWPPDLQPDGIAPGGVDDQLVSFVDLGPSVLALAGVPVPGFMQGRPVLQDGTAPRRYVFAQKDRLDEWPFRERAVRDARFKYLRNELSGAPGAVPIAYRDQLAIMGELWELAGAGRLSDVQGRWFQPQPPEALYDLDADPFEVVDLAGDPAYVSDLERLRAVLDERMAAVDAWGATPEAEMAERFWPGGEAPVTPAPLISEHGPGRWALRPAAPGASLAWRENDGAWRVVGPEEVFVPAPGATVMVKSVRYGWRESDPVDLETETPE